MLTWHQSTGSCTTLMTQPTPQCLPLDRLLKKNPTRIKLIIHQLTHLTSDKIKRAKSSAATIALS